MIYENTKYIQNITPESFKNAEKDMVFPITANFTNPSVTTPPFLFGVYHNPPDP